MLNFKKLGASVLSSLSFLAAAQPAFAGWSATATYYADWYHGRSTANGETFSQHGYTAAHPSLPFGTLLLVSWRGRSVQVRVNDRCNCSLDLSRQAAADLGILSVGVADVRVERLN
jgi:rare lipoprotein A